MKHKDIFGYAKWIMGDETAISPLFRKIIKTEKIKKAEITIGVLGFFELHINGVKVSDDLFLPIMNQDIMLNTEPSRLQKSYPTDFIVRNMI